MSRTAKRCFVAVVAVLVAYGCGQKGPSGSPDADVVDESGVDIVPDLDDVDTETSDAAIDADDPDVPDEEDVPVADVDEEEGGGIVLTAFVTIRAAPSTSFTMGSPEAEAGREVDEVQHVVTLTRDFEIMENEVRQDEFELLMGYNPSHLVGAGWRSRPVETLNWHQAAEFANELSAREPVSPCYTCTGAHESVYCVPEGAWATPYDCPGYRLPTEAEWEYAARAGTTTSTYNGDCVLSHCTCSIPCPALVDIAWYECTAFGLTQTYEVKTKDPNVYGLYDMLGNVQEWCHDWYAAYPGDITDPWGPTSGTERVTRGGSWYDDACETRCAGRSSYADTTESLMIGFRLVRTLP